MSKSQLFAAFCLALCFTNSGVSQSVRGTILGTVTDDSGAIIRGASVVAHQTATGLTRTEHTNEAGEYSIPQLPVGPYIVSVEQPGFKKTERTGIELQVDDKLRIDVVLPVGQLTETVAVEATSPVVSTDSATLGTVVSNREVTELPLNGRNFLQLNLLVPGVNQGVKGSQNQTQGGSISVNGVREQSNNFLLDGMDNNDLAINQYAVAISTEAIQEFKVQARPIRRSSGVAPALRSTSQARRAPTQSTACFMSTFATALSTPKTSLTGLARFLNTAAISMAPRSAVPSRKTRRSISQTTKETASAKASQRWPLSLPPL